MKLEKVPFRNWDLVVWVNEQDGDAWVAVRPIVEAIGVAWKPQYQKILSNPAFSCYHMVTHDSSGRQQEMLCLPVRQINGWLYSINARKVRPDLRDKLLQFQEECHIALHNHMSGKVSKSLVEHLEAVIIELKAERALLREEIAYLRTKVAEMAVLGQRLGSLESQFNEAFELDVSAAGKKLSQARHLRSVK